MRRLLIIAPHFPPTNAADGQRVRMYLPHFQQHGWQPTVLAVAAGGVHAPIDPFLLEAIPTEVEVRRIEVPTARWLGDTLARRAFWPLMQSARRMLAEQHFDLAYISTTQFLCFALGPTLLRRRGVPYVLDFQDPWRNDYYDRTGIAPPGGRLRNGISALEARWLEPWCVRNAAGITSVSPDYAATLTRRYGGLAAELILPFGYDRTDARRAAAAPRATLPFDPADGRAHWVSVGRGGPDMLAALVPLFAALRRRLDREPSLGSRLQLHFIGTSYAAADRATGCLDDLIGSHGLTGIVVESPPRISFLAALQALQQAAVLLLPSSDDASYNPSKLFSSLASGRPTLLLAPADSHAAAAAAAIGGVHRLGIDHPADRADRLLTQLLSRAAPAPDPLSPALTAMEAEALCARLCAFFDQIVESRSA